MNVTYKTNGAATTKSMTEWYFGQGFVKNSTADEQMEDTKANISIVNRLGKCNITNLLNCFLAILTIAFWGRSGYNKNADCPHG